MELNKIYTGCCYSVLKTFPDKSIHCIITSPPYWALRDYKVKPTEWPEVVYTLFGFEIKIPAQTCCLGLEKDLFTFVGHLVLIFRECKRVLRDDGTMWVNMGDSYIGNGAAFGSRKSTLNGRRQGEVDFGAAKRFKKESAIAKPKDMAGVPWMLAFALREDGWYLRQDIIWCLSGGTNVYARTKKGDSVMTIKDLYRLDPKTVKLWNGSKWTQLLGMSRSERSGSEIEIVLRSGDRISCTPTHKFPTKRGLLDAGEILVGDKLISCNLPEPETVKDCVIDEDAAWLAGVYLADGSRSEDTIQISGHSKNEYRWNRVQEISKKYGGSAVCDIDGNKQNIRIYGRVINSILYELVSGNSAHNKGFSPVVWKYSNSFIRSMIVGYLSGDGHWDENNNRWRLGFTRNYNLERDLRTACARLGYRIILKQSYVDYKGKRVPSFRGEIRMERSGHLNEKCENEVVSVNKARCRFVYDLGVEDEPHLFSLASGVLTHNSKPNPMPESTNDRCTKSHEYIFLLAKSPKYYFSAEAIATPYKDKTLTTFGCEVKGSGDGSGLVASENWANSLKVRKPKQWGVPNEWATEGKHDAISHNTAESRSHKNLKDKGQPVHSMHVARLKGADESDSMAINGSKIKGHSGNYDKNGNLIGDGKANKRSVWEVSTFAFKDAHFATFPPDLIVDCIKAGCPEEGTVLDIFGGSGTTGEVAGKLNRKWVLIEVGEHNVKIAEKRLHNSLGLFKTA